MKPKIPKKVIASTKKGKVPEGYSLYLVGSDSPDPLAHVLLKEDAYWVEDFEGGNRSEWGLDYLGEFLHYLVILSKDPFKGGLVLKMGDLHELSDYIQERYEGDRLVVGLHKVTGNHGTATAGRYGTATAGEHGTATAGRHGTATAGDYGTATAGVQGTATVGVQGTATTGDYGTATAGNWGTAIAGVGGTATAGVGGTATAGDHGTATTGNRGTATAGALGTIIVEYYAGGRYRKKVGYIGEDGLQPNVKYKLNKDNEFEEVKE